MRIIAGDFGGRRFNPPAKNWPTRPTTDIAKEGLFNMLNTRINFSEAVMLDLFGGTGSHSYEFISRGCGDVTYVDKFSGCVAFVTKTAEDLAISSSIRIIRSDVFRFLKANTRQYTYIFAGPPYPLPELPLLPGAVFDNDTLAAGGLFVLEHDPLHDFGSHPRFSEARKYGTTIFSFFR